MSRFFIIGLILSLLGACSGPQGGGMGSGGSGSNAFQIEFDELQTHGQLLSYNVKGDSNRNFGRISFHTANTCLTENRLNSGIREDLINGIIVNLSGSNTTHHIFYRVLDTNDSVLVACEELTPYTHDTIAPPAPNYAPASLVAQNGTRTRDTSFIPAIGDSFIPTAADGIRFYGNATKTIYLGEIMRSELLTGGIELSLNTANTLHISFIDFAGNESAVFNSNVVITNDSIAPTIPAANQSLTQYSTTPTANLMATASGDTVRVEIRHNESATTLDFLPDQLLSGVNMPSVSNSTNTYNIVAFDDVGNESLPLIYTVINDSIAPATPTLHSDTVLLISRPVMGPSSVFKILGETGSTIEVYSNPGLTSLVTSGDTSDWASGLPINLLNDNGTNTFYVVSVDPSGNTSNSLVLTFTGDSTPPGELTLLAEILALDNSHQQSLLAPIRASSNTDISEVVISGGVATETYTMAEIVLGVNYSLNPNVQNDLVLAIKRSLAM